MSRYIARTGSLIEKSDNGAAIYTRVCMHLESGEFVENSQSVMHANYQEP